MQLFDQFEGVVDLESKTKALEAAPRIQEDLPGLCSEAAELFFLSLLP